MTSTSYTGISTALTLQSIGLRGDVGVVSSVQLQVEPSLVAGPGGSLLQHLLEVLVGFPEQLVAALPSQLPVLLTRAITHALDLATDIINQVEYQIALGSLINTIIAIGFKSERYL